MNSQSFKADALLLLMTALWGVTFVVVHDALLLADTFSFLAIRFWVGAAVATLLANRALKHPDILKPGLLMSVSMFLGFVLQTEGLKYTTPARSAFLTGLSVALVPFLSWGWLKRKPGASSLVGVGLAVVGLYLLTGGLELQARATFWGDVLTVGSAAAFAVHIVMNERYVPGRPAVALVAVQLWVIAVLSSLVVAVTPSRVEWNASFVGAILFCGVFASAVAFTVATWAQGKTPAVRAALIYALEPVFATGYSLSLGKETLGAKEAVGGTLIVLGVVTAELGGWLFTKVKGHALVDGASAQGD